MKFTKHHEMHECNDVFTCSVHGPLISDRAKAPQPVDFPQPEKVPAMTVAVSARACEALVAACPNKIMALRDMLVRARAYIFATGVISTRLAAAAGSDRRLVADRTDGMPDFWIENTKTCRHTPMANWTVEDMEAAAEAMPALFAQLHETRDAHVGPCEAAALKLAKFLDDL